MYRIKEDGTNKIVAELQTGQYEKAKDIARNMKNAENRHFWISSDGMRVWDTKEGDNENIYSL